MSPEQDSHSDSESHSDSKSDWKNAGNIAPSTPMFQDIKPRPKIQTSLAIQLKFCAISKKFPQGGFVQILPFGSPYSYSL